MFSRLFRIAFLAAVTALFAAGPAGARPESESGRRGGNDARDRTDRVEGTLAAVSGTSLTVTARGNRSVNIAFNAATRLERNGRRVTISAFQIGDRIEARLGTGGVATKIEATGP